MTFAAPLRWVLLVAAAAAMALLLLLVIAPPRADAAAGDDTWTVNPAAPDSGAWRSVAWSPETGVFVAVGPGGVMTSTDGIAWTAQTAPAAIWNGVAWSPELGLFAAIGTTGALVITSPDGVNWTAQTIVGATKPWGTITWSPDEHEFLVAAVGGGSMTSNNATTWTVAADPAKPALTHGLAWSAALALYVAVGNNGAYTSPDGTIWTLGASLPAVGWRGVAWSPTGNRFVAVGIGGGNDIMTSPDGVTWTPTPTAVTATLSAVTWSPTEGEFVAVGQGAVMSSTDGITWTSVTDPAPANTWDSIVWAPALSSYVAVSSDGTLRTMIGTVPPAQNAPPATGGATASNPELAVTGLAIAPTLLTGFGLLLFGLVATGMSMMISRRRANR